MTTRLTDLAADLGARVLGDAGPVVLTGLTLSSQRVQHGDLYAALPGSRAHGAAYSTGAVAAGFS